MSGDRPVRQAFDKLATAFGNERPEILVEVEKSRTAAAAAELLREQVQAGDPPDVFTTGSERVPALASADQVMAVDQVLGERGIDFGDSYQRLGLEALSAEQALQCMPYDVSPLVVFYNPGLVPFRKLIEPGDEPLTAMTGWTWDQFARAGRLIAGEGVKGAYVPPDLSTMMALMRSAGADIVDDPRDATSLTFSDDGNRAALEAILSVVRDPQITPNPEQLERRGAVDRFAHEQLGMLIGTKALVPRLRKIEAFDFDVYPLPRLARSMSVSEVQALCLSAGSEHAEAAADLIAFASSDKGAAILAESGGIVPAHLPTLNSLAFTQPGSNPESVLVFDNAVRRSTVTPFVTGWPELEREVAGELGTMFYDPLVDLDVLLPEIDAASQDVLAPPGEPSASRSSSPGHPPAPPMQLPMRLRPRPRPRLRPRGSPQRGGPGSARSARAGHRGRGVGRPRPRPGRSRPRRPAAPRAAGARSRG